MATRTALICSFVLCFASSVHAQTTNPPPEPIGPLALLSPATTALPGTTAQHHALSVPSLPRVLTLDLTRDANDIWDRIRRGFAMPDLDNDAVQSYQRFYLERPGFLKQVFARGGRYLYHIINEIEARGLPAELALLPMVESSYNPLAYSRARASGLWQFIPSTGRHYKLTQDKWVDERRDVIASTDAALEYLQQIYDMHGDWHLALASYNWGEGSVGRALQRNEDAGLPTEYSHLRMPAETRNYVPKLQALKNIVMNPEQFGFELPYVANRPHFVTVESPVGIDLATAARLAEMPIEEFVALNPAFNRPAITREGYSLVVPADRAEAFEARLQTLAESGPLWRTYRLKRGESLAAVAKRHRLTLSQLRQLNGLGSRSKVAPGHALLVPEGGDPRGALAVTGLIPLKMRLAN
ncbi:transglycosylase SLT domain-containing protein [Thauera sp. CAU 1555]|uniref:Transglycosylase SLT domain-containing protein n=1 Tax=Thauera sedimentorum TaxID=2767595 RepID=A0ABR9BAC3_9RHOO|nr:transglycosylase SLT domain-containing protein [Thauera sedimentorum]MBC9071511.1 transglycosylase SLT domain-containing protein [Thauera sedimentorum]MBD8502430.1 transglycosylase SLT domain-containing protein [Thauera sedimentorum]